MGLFSDDAVHLAEILVDLPLNEGQEERPADVLYTFQRLVIVVYAEYAAYHLVFFLLFPELHEFCLVKQGNGYEVIRFIPLQKALLIEELVHIDPLHLCPVDAPVPFDRQAAVFIFPGKVLDRHLFKQGRNVPVIMPFLSGNGCKFIIHPEKAAIFIKNGVRKPEALQKLLLNLAVLRRKGNHLAHKPGSAAQVLYQDNNGVNQHKNKADRCRDGPCPEEQQDYQDHPQSNQHERPSQIIFQFTGDLEILHLLLPVQRFCKCCTSSPFLP